MKKQQGYGDKKNKLWLLITSSFIIFLKNNLIEIPLFSGGGALIRKVS
jgi:hypothetical protein